MSDKSLNVVVLAGPNGSGKSTTAPALLKGTLGVTEFVNADTIAQGLSAFQPEGAAMAAGRVMLARLKALAGQRVSFAFETRLASRSLAPWLAGLKRDGYQLHLVFLWLPNADAAVARVAERVRMGGHDVPEATIRRRYRAGLRNFFAIYQPMANAWQMCDNSSGAGPILIASGEGRLVTRVVHQVTWDRVRTSAGYEG
jgi:predicted ABC-type ATPase